MLLSVSGPQIPLTPASPRLYFCPEGVWSCNDGILFLDSATIDGIPLEAKRFEELIALRWADLPMIANWVNGKVNLVSGVFHPTRWEFCRELRIGSGFVLEDSGWIEDPNSESLRRGALERTIDERARWLIARADHAIVGTHLREFVIPGDYYERLDTWIREIDEAEIAALALGIGVHFVRSMAFALIEDERRKYNQQLNCEAAFPVCADVRWRGGAARDDYSEWCKRVVGPDRFGSFSFSLVEGNRVAPYLRYTFQCHADAEAFMLRWNHKGPLIGHESRVTPHRIRVRLDGPDLL